MCHFMTLFLQENTTTESEFLQPQVFQQPVHHTYNNATEFGWGHQGIHIINIESKILQ